MRVLLGGFLTAVLSVLPLQARTAGGFFAPVKTEFAAANGAIGRTPQASAIPVLAVEMPVIGRLIGAGGVLFKTSLDVQNNTGTPMEVDSYLNGVDLQTGAKVSAVGYFYTGGGVTVGAYRNVHFDDIVDTIIAGAGLDPVLRTHGFLGSMLLNFQGAETGDGAAQARFYSSVDSSGGSLAGGTIGVSTNGHELDGAPPKALVGLFRDSRGDAGVPQLYSNLFLNDAGYPDAGGKILGDDVTVRLTAYSASTGQAAGVSKTIHIGAFQTVAVGDILSYLEVPSNESQILVFASVESGISGILGVAALVDATTKDPSGFEMAPAGSVPPPPPPPSAVDVSGTWDVIASITGGNVGPVGTEITGVFVLVQTGSTVSGTFEGEGGLTGTVSGSVSGHSLSFTIQQGPTCPGTFTGSGTISSGSDEVDGSYSGSDSCGETISATFVAYKR
jgi:hypothetical protein